MSKANLRSWRAQFQNSSKSPHCNHLYSWGQVAVAPVGPMTPESRWWCLDDIATHCFPASPPTLILSQLDWGTGIRSVQQQFLLIAGLLMMLWHGQFIDRTSATELLSFPVGQTPLQTTLCSLSAKAFPKIFFNSVSYFWVDVHSIALLVLHHKLIITS